MLKDGALGSRAMLCCRSLEKELKHHKTVTVQQCSLHMHASLLHAFISSHSYTATHLKTNAGIGYYSVKIKSIYKLETNVKLLIGLTLLSGQLIRHVRQISQKPGKYILK